MKNNGFTLMELLGVIVILGALAIIVTISTGTTINNSKTKLSEIQIQKVEKAAELYYLSEGANESFFNLDEGKTCVNISYLTENDYLETSEIKDPKDNSEILGSVKIIYESKKYKYEYQDTQCNHSDYFVSVDTVCDLISDADSSNSITPGDKYQCKVKDKMETGFENGYYFYVLSYNDKDGNITEDITKAKTINLIMERNMYYDEDNDVGIVATETNTGTVSWVSHTDYGTGYDGYGTWGSNKKGPITAMNYLHNATKDWDNVPNIIMNYIDEGNGYGSIKTTNNVTQITTADRTVVNVLTNKDGYINLKARMPKYSEVTGEGKCTSDVSSCPLWMSNYLQNNNGYVSGEGVQYISGIEGYWTIDSKTDTSSESIIVTCKGYTNSSHVLFDTTYGVRPVITLGI